MLWKKLRYMPLSTSEVDSEDLDSKEVDGSQAKPLIAESLGKMRTATPTTKLLLCQACVNFVWSLALFLATGVIFTMASHRGDIQEYHDTDIAGARSLITRKPVKFTAGLYWNSSDPSTTIRIWNEDEPRYVGPRTSELDAAWDAISLPLDIFVTDDEARAISSILEPMYRDPTTGQYMAVLEATHSIHCLNMLRQRIYLEDYPELASKVTMDNHIDHCIEALRMNLMCTADMTIAPVWYSPIIDKVQPNFEIVHSCRNFEPLVEFAKSRRVHPESTGHIHGHFHEHGSKSN